MGHFAAAKDDHDFYAISIVEKTVNFAEFYIKVIIADFEANFHLFKLGLFFAGFFADLGFFFHLLVLVFTPIDDFNDRRSCSRGNLYKINAFVSGESEGFAARHEAELFSIRSNYANLGVADFSVDFGA